jgi:hypothetical protein
MPSGVDALDGDLWAGLTMNDIDTGAVRTWKYAGKNGMDIDPQSVAQNAYSRSEVAEVTTPGVVRLPVCSPVRLSFCLVAVDKPPVPSGPSTLVAKPRDSFHTLFSCQMAHFFGLKARQDSVKAS